MLFISILILLSSEKLNIWKTRIKASSPIISQQIEGGKAETVTDCIFLGSKITAESDCSRKIKRHLLLGRKAMTNPDSVLKNRDITLLTKVHIVKATILPVVTYGCESWTIRKAECQRIDAFELWCKGLSRVFSNTTVQKHQCFSTQPYLWSNFHIHTWPLEKP